MQRIFGALAMAVAVVALPQFAAAQDGKRPERPNPEVMFNRLDVNHDGVITPNEVPAGMPERLKNLLLQTIKNHGGKLTKAELVEAINRHRESRSEGHGGFTKVGAGTLTLGGANRFAGATTVHTGGAGFGGPGQHPMGPFFAARGPAMPGMPGMPGFPPGPRPEAKPPTSANGTGTLVVNGNLIINGGTVIINGGTLVVGGPAGALKGAATPGRPTARPMGRGATFPMFNARAIFDRLDTNHDGKLSFEEFAVGVRHLHAFLAAKMGELQRPFWDRMRSFGKRMGQFRGQFGHPGMGPMGGRPGMGPMGQHSGMGAMGGHPGMGPMGMVRAFGGHQGPGDGKVLVRVFMGADGGKHGVKKPAVACSKCGAKTPEACTCGKKHEAKKCEAKKCEAKKCEAKKCEAKKCEAKKCEAKKCEAKKCEEKKCEEKKCEEKKCEAGKSAGHRSIEERLTALETQQAEILKLLRSVTKPDHHGRGAR